MQKPKICREDYTNLSKDDLYTIHTSSFKKDDPLKKWGAKYQSKDTFWGGQIEYEIFYNSTNHVATLLSYGYAYSILTLEGDEGIGFHFETKTKTMTCSNEED